MSESIEASLVRIRASDGEVVGAGFLVGERQILTCAHVIARALDLPEKTTDTPSSTISLDFPLLDTHRTLRARVIAWHPVQEDGDGDIAGLELLDPAPANASAMHLSPAHDVWKHHFHAFGFPTGHPDGVLATGYLLRRQATGWIQIEDVKTPGFAVGPGWSGGPVYDEQLQGVVGMVVASSSRTETKTAFLIPSDVLLRSWPLLSSMLLPEMPRNPYKGLDPFTTADAADFFGREQLITTLVEQLQAALAEIPPSRLLAVIGPSGSGKSSVVLAGLLPKLQQGGLPGSQDWIYLEPITPGRHPLEALIQSLSYQFPLRSFTSLREDLLATPARGFYLLTEQVAAAKKTHVFLLIDQFEELFTQTTDNAKQEQFIDLLATAATELQGRLIIVLTLRADFYDRPMHYPSLHPLLQSHQVAVLPMAPADLRNVIEKPASRPDVQLRFEEHLVEDLLFEMRGQMGALPLLQFTLDQLVQRRDGRLLTRYAYQDIGGIKGALVGHAEATYHALHSEDDRQITRTLFLRLVDQGQAEQDITRRRIPSAELTFSDPEQTQCMERVVQIFVRARLLTINTIAQIATLEVSHEAVLQEWSRLAGWIREAREDIRLHKIIAEDAAEWKRRDTPVDRLYRGSQLDEALAWQTRNLVSIEEEEFLTASTRTQERQAQVEQEREAQQELLRKRYTRRTILIGLTGAAVATVGISAAVVWPRSSILPSIKLPFIYSHGDVVDSLAWSSNKQNKFLASASADKTVDLWDGSSGKITYVYKEHQDEVVSVAWSPDGTRIASVSIDKIVRVWEASTGATLYTYNKLKGQVTPAGNLKAVAWSPDSKWLASTGFDGTVHVWRADTGATVYIYDKHQKEVSYEANREVNSVAWSPDSKWLASAGFNSTVHVWRADTGELRYIYKGYTSPIISVAWSPDGTRLACSGFGDLQDTNFPVHIWEASTGKYQLSYDNHNWYVYSVAWSPDSKLLASVGDSTAQVWEAGTGRHRFTYDKHDDQVKAVAWSSDGKWLASAGFDHTVQIWEGIFGVTRYIFEKHREDIFCLVWIPTRKPFIISGSRDHSIKIWNGASGYIYLDYTIHTEGVASVAYSPDNQLLASAGFDGFILVRRLKTKSVSGAYPYQIPHEHVFEYQSPQPYVMLTVAWSPNGQQLAFAGTEGVASIWKVGSQTPSITYTGHIDSSKGYVKGDTNPSIKQVAWFPGGQFLASASADGTVHIWDAVTGETANIYRGHQDEVNSVAWSLDGSGRLASASADGTVHIWDAVTGETLYIYRGHQYRGHHKEVTSVAWSPPYGTRLASASVDRTVQVWDALTYQTLYIYRDHRDEVTSVVWSPDSELLASASFDKTVRIWSPPQGEIS